LMWPPAFHRLVRIRFASEGHDLGDRRQGGREKEIEGPGRNKAMLEADAPVVRPEFNVLNLAGDESLAITMARQHIVAIIHNPVVKMGVSPQGKAVDGGVADALFGLVQIARNTIMPKLVIKKIIEPAGDDNVEIEIKDLSRDALQLLLPQRDFPPW